MCTVLLPPGFDPIPVNKIYQLYQIMGQKGPALRTRYIKPTRARTQTILNPSVLADDRNSNHSVIKKVNSHVSPAEMCHLAVWLAYRELENIWKVAVALQYVRGVNDEDYENLRMASVPNFEIS